MKLIKPNVEEWYCGYTLPEIWSHIAKCARVCYQSEPRNNGETDEEFVDRVILRNHSFDEIANNRELQLKLHLSCLEHGTVYLDIPEDSYKVIKRKLDKYYKVNIHDEVNKIMYAITTNMRVIIEKGLSNYIVYLCTPTKYHYLRTTFNITTDIGVARELARHRTHSISEESTRYCNYSKDKFGKELTFIIPQWIKVHTWDCSVNMDDILSNLVYNPSTNTTQALYDDKATKLFFINLCKMENMYFSLINYGWTPQQVRQMLPINTKVQTVHTAFNSDWDEFVKLRADGCSGSVHPNMNIIANKIKSLMSKENATN